MAGGESGVRPTAERSAISGDVRSHRSGPDVTTPPTAPPPPTLPWKRLGWMEPLGLVLLSIMAALLGVDAVLYWSDVRGSAFRLIPLIGSLGGVAHAKYLLGRRTAFGFFLVAV